MEHNELAIKIALSANTNIFEQKSLEDYGYSSYTSLWEDISSYKFSLEDNDICFNVNPFELDIVEILSSIILDISTAFLKSNASPIKLHEIAVKAAFTTNTTLSSQKQLKEYGYPDYTALWEDVSERKFSLEENNIYLNCDPIDLTAEEILSSIITSISYALKEMNNLSH